MNKKDFFESIGELDEKYYAEAATFKRKKSGAALKWTAVAAACLCVLIFGAAAFWGGSSLKPENNNANALAPTVILDKKTYYVCGEGESEILKKCGLSKKLDSSLAGKHVSYLRKNDYEYAVQSEKDNSSAELFEYAPKPNKNVYIICYEEKYYAAILHDENGYHGIDG